MVELFFVDNQKAVVDMLGAVNFNDGVLRVVLVKVEAKAGGNALGVNSCSHAFRAFGED